MAKEIWKPVYGWNGWYEVSDLGRVRSVTRRSRCSSGPCVYQGKLLKASPARNGYLRVSLSAPGGVKYKNVHSLVMETFVGPRPKGKEVCHNDGNKKNSKLKNLRYGTTAENAQDTKKHRKKKKRKRL